MGLAAETAKLVAQLSLEDKFSGPSKKVTGSLGALEKGVGRVGKGAGQVGAGLTRAGAIIGTAVVGGFAGAAKAAIDWEDAFTGVIKTVDASDADLATLSENLRKISTEGPTTANELAGIAEAAGAMGVGFDSATGKTSTADIEAFTKQVAILASTTDVGAQDAATALGQLTNVMGLAGDEYDNFAASLVDLGNKGASTESQILEIARRAGGAAKLFGIAKDETLGWASAAANLGLNEELAGTALQNTFVKLLPQINKGSKTLSEVMGKSAKDVKKAFKQDAGGALETFIAQLGKMPADQRLSAVTKLFGKGSGITRLVLGLADTYEKNLKPSLDTATEAWKDATAAQIEFDKRNATVKSSIARLKNTVIDAAVTVGEGFAPALGRASDKLSKFLSQGENREFLKDIGKDIGEAIDGIDWEQVIKGGRTFVDTLKVAFDYAGRILGIINSLPTEVKAAGAGFLVLDKLSGGLLGAGAGNIVGGIGETIVRSLGTKLPGALGKAFVQPVFVTNFPAGGLGGAGGAAGAAGKGLSAVGKVFLVGEAIGLALAVNEVKNSISAESTAQAQAINDQTSRFIATQPSKAALENALAGVDRGIADLKSNPLNVLVQGEALTELEAMRAKLTSAIADRPNELPAGKAADDLITPAIDKTTTSIESMKGRIATELAGTTGAVDAMKGKIADDLSVTKSAITAAEAATKAAATTAGSTAASAARQAGYGVEGAIRANRPIVTTDVKVYVTAGEVTKSVVQSSRVGPTGGSATGHAPGTGPLI